MITMHDGPEIVPARPLKSASIAASQRGNARLLPLLGFRCEPVLADARMLDIGSHACRVYVDVAAAAEAKVHTPEDLRR